MIDLKDATVMQLSAACALDNIRGMECTAALATHDANPWPPEWQAIKELFTKGGRDNPGVEWLAEIITSAESRIARGKTSEIAPLLCRAVLVGYELAKAQMLEELERVAS